MDDVEFQIFQAGESIAKLATSLDDQVAAMAERSPSLSSELKALTDRIRGLDQDLKLMATRWHDSES